METLAKEAKTCADQAAIHRSGAELAQCKTQFVSDNLVERIRVGQPFNHKYRKNREIHHAPVLGSDVWNIPLDPTMVTPFANL